MRMQPEIKEARAGGSGLGNGSGNLKTWPHRDTPHCPVIQESDLERADALDAERREQAAPELPKPLPVPGIEETPSPPLARVPVAGIRERDEVYPCLVRAGDVRVIECRDGIQWILQRRRPGGRWTDLGYFRNRDALIERSELDLAELRALPPHHFGRGGAS